MDIVLLKAIYKLISGINAVFPSIKNLSYMEIGILATIIVSAIIAIFQSTSDLLKQKDIRNSFDLFMYSFLGGLFGGIIGTGIGLLLSSMIYLIIPPDCDFICDWFYPIRLMVFISVSWFFGVLTGGIKTIRPVIRFFSARNR